MQLPYRGNVYHSVSSASETDSKALVGKYRGVSIQFTNSITKSSASETDSKALVGKYRGVSIQFINSIAEPSSPTLVSLRYRGISYPAYC